MITATIDTSKLMISNELKLPPLNAVTVALAAMRRS